MIKYRKGYKYVLAENMSAKTLVQIQRNSDVRHPFARLCADGTLHVSAGYAWDGASGPTIDTESSMIASLIHDVLYQMIRDGSLPYHHKEEADRTFYEQCLKSGMNSFRAWVYYKALQKFGHWGTSRRATRQVYHAN